MWTRWASSATSPATWWRRLPSLRRILILLRSLRPWVLPQLPRIQHYSYHNMLFVSIHSGSVATFSQVINRSWSITYCCSFDHCYICSLLQDVDFYCFWISGWCRPLYWSTVLLFFWELQRKYVEVEILMICGAKFFLFQRLFLYFDIENVSINPFHPNVCTVLVESSQISDSMITNMTQTNVLSLL